MRKRIAAAGLAVTTAAAVLGGAAPAQAYDDPNRDSRPAIPCNIYPAGKPFTVTAAPARATINRGASTVSVAGVTRGVGSDRKPCKYHLVILRYAHRPNDVIKAHRTNENGAVGFVIGPLRGSLWYYYQMVYGSVSKKSNGALITVR